jgi:hypothetical protein
MSTIFQTCRNLPTPLISQETRKSRVGYLFAGLTGSKLAKVWALESLKYGLRPPAWSVFSLNWGSSVGIFVTQVTMLRVLFNELPKPKGATLAYKRLAATSRLQMIGSAIEHLKAKRKDKETLVQEKQARLEDSPRLNTTALPEDMASTRTPTLHLGDTRSTSSIPSH